MDNELVFEQKRKVSSAFIDSTVKLGTPQAVLMVQDNLTECFGKMKCDGIVYRDEFNAFWVFTKTKLHFIKRPDWQQEISAATFPINNLGMRTHVNTILKDLDGNTLLTANQEACVLDLEKHRPLKITNLPYPKENFPEPVFTEPFEKFDLEMTEEDFVYEQVIRSQHIDMSHHMNNIEYVKLGMNVFSDDFIESNEPKDLEVHYTGESKEGQILRVYCKQLGGAYVIRIKESERFVFEMKVSFY